MSYPSLKACLIDLEANNQLIKLTDEVDTDQVIAEIQRLVYEVQGPALWFMNIKGSSFQAASNVFGTKERSHYIFRDIFDKLEEIIKLKEDPLLLLKQPSKMGRTLAYASKMMPLKSWSRPAILKYQTQIDKLPSIKSWPMDGGGFVTLPQVISFPPGSRKISDSNVGMYRIQLDGNDYIPNQEIGLHYQIHRGIGNHHQLYNHSNKAFKISIAVGGPPAYTLASIFPLPESLSEIMFSGLLNNRRYRYTWQDGFFIPSDVDFCITGEIQKNKLKPEGPFGDHLGYYSLKHLFPVMDVKNVYHKKDPIWHFTAVGRPPQEDSSFGYLIHQMVKEITKQEFPGVEEIHAVDAAGVHPLLLAIGKERYMPFRDKKPEEILTLANLILGKGQTSLAKYLIISGPIDKTDVNTRNILGYLQYVLERVDWRFDLHFQTNTTIDTLDYSGEALNAGSKVVIACNREIQRELNHEFPSGMDLPIWIKSSHIFAKGIALLQADKFESYAKADQQINLLTEKMNLSNLDSFPLFIIVDDAVFCKENLNNFLWVTFTRSNPSHDIYGVRSFTKQKHWGCAGPLIIDARIKPHHAPVLVSDPKAEIKAKEIIFKNQKLKSYFK